VTLWDAKFRGRRIRLQGSSAFKLGLPPGENAIQKAAGALKSDKTLPPVIRSRAIRNLQLRRINTRTAGFGKAKNSTWGK